MQAQNFMRVEEVAQELGISKSHAYKVIHKLNAELREKGYLTISGRVNRNFFKMCIRDRPPHHPVGRKCAFDGRQAVKSAFALLSQKVTKARR